MSPVLTAHPTEVQRKSILDCEREIARLLQWRDRVELTPDEAAEFETGLYRQVLALWQTAMLRLSKLRVEDEIENGLAYYRYTFLAEVPRLYAGARRAARARRSASARRRAAAVPAHGLVDRRRPRRQSVRHRATRSRTRSRAQAAVAFEHYLDEVHRLGAELSLSTRLVHADAGAAARSPTPRTTPIRIARTSRTGRR